MNLVIVFGDFCPKVFYRQSVLLEDFYCNTFYMCRGVWILAMLVSCSWTKKWTFAIENAMTDFCLIWYVGCGGHKFYPYKSIFTENMQIIPHPWQRTWTGRTKVQSEVLCLICIKPGAFNLFSLCQNSTKNMSVSNMKKPNNSIISISHWYDQVETSVHRLSTAKWGRHIRSNFLLFTNSLANYYLSQQKVSKLSK